MTNPTSFFINSINELYPSNTQTSVTSQVIRDNFKNSKLALTSLDQDLDYIKNNTANVLNASNDFNDNIQKKIVFQNVGNKSYNLSNSIFAGDVTVDYKNGNFQKFAISAGFHAFDIINWPGNNINAMITLAIITETNGTQIHFTSKGSVISFGMQNFPIEVRGQGPHLFDIINNGTNDDIYIRPYGHYLNIHQATHPSQVAGAENGTITYFSGNINAPAYYSNGTWYTFTNTTLLELV